MPSGTIVLPFQEFALEGHWPVFAATVAEARGRDRHPLNVFVERDAIQAWARGLDLTVVDMRSGEDHFVPLPTPITLEPGVVLPGHANLGQSVCVLARP